MGSNRPVGVYTAIHYYNHLQSIYGGHMKELVEKLKKIVDEHKNTTPEVLSEADKAFMMNKLYKLLTED